VAIPLIQGAIEYLGTAAFQTLAARERALQAYKKAWFADQPIRQ
jgi:hypothetical protein